MTDTPPIIVWFRRDLRLSDHAALTAAIADDAPIIPVFILDEVAETWGAAPLFRLELSLDQLERDLRDKGSRLILRRGRALPSLRALIAETGARAVHWTRAYDPASIARDTEIKTALRDDGIAARSHPGHVLFEPWTVETGQGGPYKVYSPFWRAVRDRDPGRPLPAPGRIPGPDTWPASDALDEWELSAAMGRGACIVADHVTVGDSAASQRLAGFIARRIDPYREARDMVAEDATSGLSENLTWGEISPRAIWWAGQRAMDDGKGGAEHFLKELVWRDFAWHLAWHTPHLLSDNWRDGWDGFPWSTDPDAPEVRAWKQGRTGIAFVDAAMRELYVTGTMHNRARMVVASYLTKHLMCHWKIGMDWFAHTLIDWDPASNAMGWQRVAGSGTEAAPSLRVSNADTQAEKFDPDGIYRRRWIAEGTARPTATALSYFDAIPRDWGLSPQDAYPGAPVVALDQGRKRALAAYENRNF